MYSELNLILQAAVFIVIRELQHVRPVVQKLLKVIEVLNEKIKDSVFRKEEITVHYKKPFSFFNKTNTFLKQNCSD